MRLFLFLTIITLSFTCKAQVTEEIIAPQNIKTIILQELTSERQIPLIELGKTLTLRFDDINGDEADYYYRIQQYNFDWTPSSLMKQEYLKGMDEQHIQDYENSYNTLQLYSHFRLNIPNQNCRITKTGNYIIEIYNDDEEIVFSKKFIVYQDRANVGVEIKRSRDLNFIESKQIVQYYISPRNNFFNNPKQNIKTLVFKNNNIKNAITNLKPQYTIGNKLMYRYDQEASFWAGNEYFYFDNKDIRGGNISLQHTELGDLYNNYLYTNRSRRHDTYTYNPDINGGFVVRNLNADDSNIEADYSQVHFSLENFENLGDRKVYVVGNFNNYELDEASELKFDPDTATYKNTSLIKQGFVNYKFITHTDNEIDHSLIDGNFHQTENEYTVVVYYRDVGARYDQVIGLGSATSINISN